MLHRPLLRRLPLLAFALLLGGASCAPLDVEIGVPHTDGTLPIEILLQSGQDPSRTTVTLSGVDVTNAFTPTPTGLRGDVALPPPGPFALTIRTLAPSGVPGLPIPYTLTRNLHSPGSAPAFVAADPGGAELPRTAWLRLRFDDDVPASSIDGTGFGIECDGRRVERRVHRVAEAVVLDPTPELPAGASCRVAWRGPAGGVEESLFQVSADRSPPLRTLHDRNDATVVTPFPDDYHLATDTSTPTGRRVAMEEPPLLQTVRDVYAALLPSVNEQDGFSRIAPIVIGVSDALDPALVPSDAYGAIDPFAPIALFDLDPESPEYGRRIPYLARFRTDENRIDQTDHSITIFPSIALRPQGRYGLVVTRRLFAQTEPGRPLLPSAFFAQVAGAPGATDSTAVQRARPSIDAVLDFAAENLAVPIAREDVALAVRISVRSDDSIPSDLRHVKDQALANPPPPVTITSVAPLATGGAVLRGTVQLTSWLDPVFARFVRDAQGRPVPQGSEAVPFVLRLPAASTPGPVPIVMYQHGNPGSPDEILSNGLNGYLIQDGYAVAGIRDYGNRRLGNVASQIAATFFFLLQTRSVPGFWNQSGADQIGFLRALQGLGGTAWRPANAPQTPLLDPTRLLYHGISEGGNHALRFLPFAPELLAATPTVGGGRLVETLLHQFPGLLGDLEGFIAGVRPVETLVGLSLFQNAYDRQDPHSYARFVYQAPLVFPGLPGARAPSVLWTEGIGDSLVPNNATRSAARELGIPTVRTVRGASPVLAEVDAPLSANLAPDRTAGHFQYLPSITPGCDANYDGHYCPQTSPAAQAQRLHFFETALGAGAPVVVDPID